ncbi:MAG: VOC family protein [Alphaproteobacteria bacterium]|nr:VOC family protein [Alphaproteobacteria bacterium]
MTAVPLGLRVFQNSYVVPDIDAALQRWTRKLGVGPFYIYRHLDLGPVTYRGKPSTLDASFALAQAGDIEVELIQQHDDAPSAYRDVYARDRGGFHHVGAWVEDFDAAKAAYERLGYPAVTTGGAPDIGGRFAYMDTRADLGVMVELVEQRQDLLDFQVMLTDAARDWDGAEPVREVGL